jgi:hypothetical protein
MPDRSRPASPPAECAQCGASIPRHARSCPECGADERTGWRESSVYDGVDLPEDTSEDRDTAEKKPPSHRDVNGLRWYWWAIGVALAFLAILRVLRLI